MWPARAHNGRWSLSSDVVYLKIPNEEGAGLVPNLPDLATLRKTGLRAWTIQPSVGYTLYQNDKQHGRR